MTAFSVNWVVLYFESLSFRKKQQPTANLKHYRRVLRFWRAIKWTGKFVELSI